MRLEPAPPIPPADPSTEARLARLARFQREHLIVSTALNRGVSVAEVAARVGVGETRVGAIIRDPGSSPQAGAGSSRTLGSRSWNSMRPPKRARPTARRWLIARTLRRRILTTFRSSRRRSPSSRFNGVRGLGGVPASTPARRRMVARKTRCKSMKRLNPRPEESRRARRRRTPSSRFSKKRGWAVCGRSCPPGGGWSPGRPAASL